MPTAREHLAILYPWYVTVDDPRFPGADVLAWAEAAAADYRPRCLSVERQNQAQAYYMAYLLGSRAQAASGSLVTSGSVRRAKEGDVEVEYATALSASDGGALTPYQSWKLLNDLCRFGALLTRFG